MIEDTVLINGVYCVAFHYHERKCIMQINSPAYSEPINLSPLEEALIRGVADNMGLEPEEVGEALIGRHGVPSDAFMSAYDDEISALTRLVAVQ